MPDISMCTATTCVVAGRCYRNTASGTVADLDQSWMEFEPEKGAECEGFWSTTQPSTVPMTHLERAPEPADSELFGTPIIDNWQTLAIRDDDGSKHYVARGQCAGDRRWLSGTPITTSLIASIDAHRRWLRTQNTLYRLGRPHSEIPLIVAIACHPTWDVAHEHACVSMGRHTVTEWIWKLATTADGDWGRLRVRAALIAAEMESTGRSMIADAWRLLAVDATDTNAVKVVYDRMCRVAGSFQTPTASDAIDGWGMMSRGETRDVDLTDPVAAAHRLGEPRGEKETEALRELMEDDPDIPAAGPRGGGPTAGVVVLEKVGGTTETSSGKEAQREFKDIAGRRLPLVVTSRIDGARSALREEFPHLHSAIGVLLGDLRYGEPVRLRPSILVGPPGGGKSRLAQRIAHHIGVGLHRFDGAGSGDNAFGGTPRRWSSGEHCVPLEAVRRHKIANPWVLVDEVDKAAARGNNGSLANSLMPFLEKETAEKFPDPFVQFDVDLSHVSYILTANDDTLLPAPLRDRLRIVRIQEPTLDHMIQLARGIIADIARENGGDERWYPDLDDGELAIAEALWPGGSVRRLRAIVERILAHRELNPRN